MDHLHAQALGTPVRVSRSAPVSSALAALQCWSLSHVQLCDHRYCSLPGSFVHGTSQSRILEECRFSFKRSS